MDIIDNIFCDDCLNGFLNIPSESIDLVVSDPPYKVIGRGTVGTMGGYWSREKAQKGKIFDDNDIDIASYIGELYRVLKNGTHCYIMCNNYNLPHFFDVIGKSRFGFIRLLTWDKHSAICGRYYMSQTEHIFMLRKGRERKVNDCGVSDLLSFPLERDKKADGTNIHDSQKPVRLFQRMIEQSSNPDDIVLDPFMGSGTTAVACIRSKRHYTGFEINPEYYNIALERIRLTKASPTLF